MQVAMSATAVGIVYLMYQIGKKQQDAKKSENGEHSGISDNWGKDPVIAENHNRNLIESETPYPTCQVWNEKWQLFLDTGDAESNLSKNACFTKFSDSDNPRYLTSPTDITYKREDPLQEDPSLAGTCYFYEPPNPPDFPNESYTTFPNLGGLTPVNRSTRLCFASGETPDKAGRYFSSGGKVTWQPFFLVPGNENNAQPYPRCEKYGQYSVAGHTAIASGWGIDSTTSALNTVESCLAASPDNRWRDETSIVFTNPFNKTMVTMKNEVY